MAIDKSNSNHTLFKMRVPLPSNKSDKPAEFDFTSHKLGQLFSAQNEKEAKQLHHFERFKRMICKLLGLSSKSVRKAEGLQRIFTSIKDHKDKHTPGSVLQTLYRISTYAIDIQAQKDFLSSIKVTHHEQGDETFFSIAVAGLEIEEFKFNYKDIGALPSRAFEISLSLLRGALNLQAKPLQEQLDIEPIYTSVWEQLKPNSPCQAVNILVQVSTLSPSLDMQKAFFNETNFKIKFDEQLQQNLVTLGDIEILGLNLTDEAMNDLKSLKPEVMINSLNHGAQKVFNPGALLNTLLHMSSFAKDIKEEKEFLESISFKKTKGNSYTLCVNGSELKNLELNALDVQRDAFLDENYKLKPAVLDENYKLKPAVVLALLGLFNEEELQAAYDDLNSTSPSPYFPLPVNFFKDNLQNLIPGRTYKDFWQWDSSQSKDVEKSRDWAWISKLHCQGLDFKPKSNDKRSFHEFDITEGFFKLNDLEKLQFVQLRSFAQGGLQPIGQLSVSKFTDLKNQLRITYLNKFVKESFQEQVSIFATDYYHDFKDDGLSVAQFNILYSIFKSLNNLRSYFNKKEILTSDDKALKDRAIDKCGIQLQEGEPLTVQHIDTRIKEVEIAMSLRNTNSKNNDLNVNVLSLFLKLKET